MTGLGRKQGHLSPIKILDSTKADGSIDYQHLEKPTVMRKHAVPVAALHHTPPKPAVTDTQELDYLDIPAFLRRKEETV